MTREEIDVMWQQALQASVRDGEQFTRYHFAALVAERERADERERVIRAVEYIDHGRWTLAELRECVELHYIAPSNPAREGA